jgi:dTDP-4-dehydrorhamnose reductase
MNNLIAVTGASGQVGQALALLAPSYPAYRFVFLDRQACDIGQRQQVGAWMRAHRPAWCINCAAYTAVDRAEEDQENARLVNTLAPGFLAEACAATHTRLVHLSTNYVFDGQAWLPVPETATPRPLGVYGQTKWEGEQAVWEHLPEAVVVRTAGVYAAWGHNFVKTMLQLGKQGKSLRVVADQLIAPTYAPDLAKALLVLVTATDSGMVQSASLYHYQAEGAISWYDFAMQIFEVAGLEVTVAPIPTTAYPTPAKRPAYGLLDTARFKQDFGVTIPYWKQGLRQCLQLLQQQDP